MKVFIVLTLALAAVSAEFAEKVRPKDVPRSAKIEGRIVNGYSAPEGRAAYTVGLGFSSSGGGWWCGGSIISNTWIITAAHCTNGGESVTIHYGGTSRTQAVFTHTVGRGDWVQCQYWPEHNGNDVSLIRMPHVDFWDRVNKVELPSFNDRGNSYDGWWAVACGWGGTYNGSPLPEWLQCADMQVISNSQCSQTYGSLPANILCVSTSDGRSTCSGDSGGPLVTHNGNKLIGVTSFVSGAGCESGHPAGFTRVTGHLDWIRDVTGVAYY